MYICLCNGITEKQIRTAVDNGAESFRAVREELGVGNQCGKCACSARDLIQDTLNDTPPNKGFYDVA